MQPIQQLWIYPGNRWNLQGTGNNGRVSSRTPNDSTDAKNSFGVKASGIRGGKIMSKKQHRGTIFTNARTRSTWALKMAYCARGYIANVSGTCS